MNMTYRELLEELQKFIPEQLDATVTVYLHQEDEYHPIHSMQFSDEKKCDVLDDNHPYLLV